MLTLLLAGCFVRNVTYFYGGEATVRVSEPDGTVLLERTVPGGELADVEEGWPSGCEVAATSIFLRRRYEVRLCAEDVEFDLDCVPSPTQLDVGVRNGYASVRLDDPDYENWMGFVAGDFELDDPEVGSVSLTIDTADPCVHGPDAVRDRPLVVDVDWQFDENTVLRNVEPWFGSSR